MKYLFPFSNEWGFSSIFFLTIFLSLFFSQKAAAQTAAAIQTGAGSTAEFHVQDTLARTNVMVIKNTNSTNEMNSVKVKLILPAGANYQVGTVSYNATEFDMSNLNQPVFTLNNPIPAASNVSFSYALKYDCNVIGYILAGGAPKDLAEVKYTMMGTTYTQNLTTGTTGYNVRYGSLSIIGATNANVTMNVGDTYNQVVTIKNGGLGDIYEARLNLDNTTGISISNISVNGSTTGVSVVGNMVVLTGNALGADKKLTLNETVLLSYDVTVNNCTLATGGRSLVASWGQKSVSTNTCQFSSPYNVGIIIANTLPNISISGAKKYSACPSTTPSEITFRIKNIGLGKAYNVICDIASFTGGNKSTYIVPNSYLISYNGQSFTAFTPTSITTGSALIPGSSTATCAVGMGKGLLHNIGTINPSQEVVIRFQTLRCDYNVCGQSDNYNDFQTTVSYNNQCGVAQMPVVYRMYSTAESAVPVAQDIPASVSNGQVATMSYELGVFPTPDTLTSRGYAMFVLSIPPKLKYEANVGDVSIKTSAGVTVNPRVGYPKLVGNQLFMKIDDYNNNLKSKTILLNIKLKADCALAGATTANVGLDVYYERDSAGCPNAHIVKRCNTAPIIVYCPGCNTQSVSFDYAKIKVGRANLGLPDNNLDGKPDATGTLDMSKIKLNRFIDGDTISISTTSVVSLAGFAAFDSVFAQHTFTNNSKHNWQATSAQVKIYDASAGTYYTITPTLSTAIAKYKYKWKWAKPAGYSYDNGDSIIVNVKYRQSNFSSDAEAPTDAVLNVVVAGRYTTSTTTYSCTPYDWNYAVNGYKPVIGGNSIIPVNATSCAGASISGVSFLVRTNAGYNGSQRFPYEYRPFYKPEKFVVTPPAGWVYKPNSNSWKESYTTQIGTSVTTSSIYQEPTINANGDIEFDMASLFASAQFPVVSTEGASYSPTFSLMPTCATTTGNANVAFKYVYRDITDNFQTQKTVLTAANHILVNYTKPSISISSGQTSQTFTGSSVSWDIAVANQNGSVSVDNVWVYLKNNAALTSIIVKPVVNGVVGTAIAPTSNGIYQLGNYSGGLTKTYRIFATSSACFNGTLDIQGGWNCVAYPTDTAAYQCQKQRLKLTSQPAIAGLDAIYDFLDGSMPNTIDACSPVEFKVILNSTLTGDISNIKVKVPLPVGLTYVPNNVKYQFPYNSTTFTGTASSYNPTTIAGTGGVDTLLFNVNSIATSLTNGLSGVYNNATKAVEFHFKLNTSCGYVYGDEVNCSVKATSACGSALPTLNRISRPTEVAGLSATSAFAIQFLTSPLNACVSNGNKMSVILTNNGTATGATDIVEATLSAGLTYIPNSAVDSINFSSIGNPTIVGNKLTWHLPAAISAGQKIAFSFRVADNGNDCADAAVSIKTKIEAVALACGGCIISKVTGLGGNAAISRQRASVQMSSAFPIISNQTATQRDLTFNVSVNNVGNASLSAGANILCAIDNNNNSVYDNGDTYVATTPITSPILAGATANIWIQMPNMPNTAKNFVIYNDPNQACVCGIANHAIKMRSISGIVLNDVNGVSNDNSIYTTNGIPNVGTNMGGAYAVLTDENHFVRSVSPINPDGTYAFADVVNGNYAVALSANNVTIGSLYGVAILPNAWLFSGEVAGNGTTLDGINNGINEPLLVNNANLTNIDFGVRELYTISGTVYSDGNGMNDNAINGTPLSSVSNMPLYINLLDINSNVVASVMVGANGTYNFSNLQPNDYIIQLSLTQGTIGNAAPISVLPNNWVWAGEGDANANGYLAIVNPANPHIEQINIGLNKRPFAEDKVYSLGFNPSLNSHIHLNGTGLLPSQLTGIDFEDGAKGAGSTFIITDISNLNSNELYYNDTLISVCPYVIENYNPSLLKIEFKPSAFNYLSFDYNVEDNANALGLVAARYSLNWNIPLPVELTQFVAYLYNENGVLAWNTSAEINSNLFVIERSLDGGATYSEIGTQNAANNSNQANEYSFVDKNVTKVALDKVYYRLKMVDNDGSYAYSQAVELVLESKAITFHVYPNPTQDVLNLEYQFFNTSSASKIQIFNAAGNEVYANEIEPNVDFSAIQFPIEVRNWVAGVYFIKIIADGKSHIKQFVKE